MQESHIYKLYVVNLNAQRYYLLLSKTVAVFDNCGSILFPHINDQYLNINDIDKITQLVVIKYPQRQRNQLNIHLTTCRFSSVWYFSMVTHGNSAQEGYEIRNVKSSILETVTHLYYLNSINSFIRIVTLNLIC